MAISSPFPTRTAAPAAGTPSTRAPLFPTRTGVSPTTVITPGVPSQPITLTLTQKAKLAVFYKDTGGKHAKVDNSPVWTTSKPEVATVSASADGLTATVVAVKAGSTTISASTAIRNGKIVATIEISVVGKDPASGFIAAGPVEEQ